MDTVYNVLNWIDSNILWGIPMIILILGCGMFLTYRTKALQIRKFGYSFSATMGDSIKQVLNKKKTGDKKNISAFEAFATAISGTVGTGNIVGVTTAIVSGGPGAVFWMWVSAFFGCITKFSEITLGMYFRKKDKQGEYVGGPMYYIENGAKSKILAILFAIFTMLAAVGMGSVQADTIQSTWYSGFSIPSWVTIIIIVVFSALVILGGIKRIGKVASLLVPFMAIAFILMALILVFANISIVPAAFGSIFTSAFTTKSLLGGFAGYGIASAMRFGFARGVFSNEAGLGSSSIAHSTSTTKEPVKQAMWGVFEVFLDTFVICTLTALFILTSGYDTTLNFDGSTIAMNAFTNVFGKFGEIAFSIILPLFAFTSILAWCVYGSKSAEYLFKKNQKKAKNIFNIIYIFVILAIGLMTSFMGQNSGSEFVWTLADMMNALMAIPNLIALFILSGLVVKIVKNYFDRQKGADIEPMISAYSYHETDLLEENNQNDINQEQNNFKQEENQNNKKEDKINKESIEDTKE